MATWKWTLDDDASDLSGADLFDKRMLRYEESSGSFVVTVPFGTTKGGFLYSPPNQPGQHVWPVGPWKVQVHVAVANSRISLEVGLARLTGAGVFVETYDAALSGPQSLGTVGLKTFSGTTRAQTGSPAPSAGDRLRVLLRFTHNGTPGSENVTLGFGDPDRDTIEAPLLMANPRIVFDGTTLNFPHPPTAYRWRRRSVRDLAFSDGGVPATSLHHQYDEVRCEVGRFEDAAFEASLRAWWSWAVRGRVYSFAMDSGDVVDQALNGAAAAGQAVIPIPNTSGVTVGRRYLVREAAGEEEEVITVLSIVPNVSVTADANLKYGYLSGDIFRSLDFFPKVVSLDDEYPVDRQITTWSFDHLMREDLG